MTQEHLLHTAHSPIHQHHQRPLPLLPIFQTPPQVMPFKLMITLPVRLSTGSAGVERVVASRLARDFHLALALEHLRASRDARGRDAPEGLNCITR